MVSFAATLLALKFAESIRWVEFDGWDGVLGAAVMCWVGSWLSAMASPSSTLGLALATEFAATIVALLLAWAFVPGARFKNAAGLVLATVLVVAFSYGAQMLVSGTGLGLL
jgi:hypothetical protein